MTDELLLIHDINCKVSQHFKLPEGYYSGNTLAENICFTVYYNESPFRKESRHFLLLIGYYLGIFLRKTFILQCITINSLL
jgi:hypothetical protein